jgi:trehalose utilization protein
MAASPLVCTSFAANLEDPKQVNKINVVVWDEQQPAQREAYPNFLGNWIAKYLESLPGLSVKSVKLDDPDKGLGDDVMNDCRVLIWWGHIRNRDVRPEATKKIVEKIKDGKLSLIALHSAHWATPFMEAMNERTRMDVEKKYAGVPKDKIQIRYLDPPQRYTLPKIDSRLTPYTVERRFPDNTLNVSVQLPFCCFPAYRTDGKPSQIRVLAAQHPIIAGVPKEFELPRTEMYDEPFHVPEPDEVILEERWASGEWFRSGMVWNVGKGRVFYLRPGHETFAIYKEKPMLQIIENAVRWLASS